jgi:hypothetical protein
VHDALSEFLTIGFIVGLARVRRRCVSGCKDDAGAVRGPNRIGSGRLPEGEPGANAASEIENPDIAICSHSLVAPGRMRGIRRHPQSPVRTGLTERACNLSLPIESVFP